MAALSVMPASNESSNSNGHALECRRWILFFSFGRYVKRFSENRKKMEWWKAKKVIECEKINSKNIFKRYRSYVEFLEF